MQLVSGEYIIAPPNTNVPDGGATLVFLGAALASIAGVQRHRHA
ncbi:MAG: VPDSG-CTERM sorting domain-containing protein [Limisphaerales bacterium]